LWPILHTHWRACRLSTPVLTTAHVPNSAPVQLFGQTCLLQDTPPHPGLHIQDPATHCPLLPHSWPEPPQPPAFIQSTPPIPSLHTQLAGVQVELTFVAVALATQLPRYLPPHMPSPGTTGHSCSSQNAPPNPNAHLHTFLDLAAFHSHFPPFLWHVEGQVLS
jgi:hypothetical protein